MNPNPPIRSSEVTSEGVYLNRRQWLQASMVAASAVGTGVAYRYLNRPGAVEVEARSLADVIPVAIPDESAEKVANESAASPTADRGFKTDEELTSFRSITNYNNFYEFTTSKEGVAGASKQFVARPWSVAVEGLVHKPRVFDLDDIRRLAPLEERIYRMRCVEAWSMVIPWNGFPLSKLLDTVEPMGSAKYVAFETLYDPQRMPGQRYASLDWPYVEGLRLDEAQHPLTILACGLYGKELPAPNGAPLRLVVPWKYGFKGIKSIVKITLTEKQPPTTWNLSAPQEYGFFSNVNPSVAHPRWSQATEQRLGELGRRPTLPFNGYADQVAHLYQGMDLRKNF